VFIVVVGRVKCQWPNGRLVRVSPP